MVVHKQPASYLAAVHPMLPMQTDRPLRDEKRTDMEEYKKPRTPSHSPSSRVYISFVTEPTTKPLFVRKLAAAPKTRPRRRSLPLMFPPPLHLLKVGNKCSVCPVFCVARGNLKNHFHIGRRWRAPPIQPSVLNARAKKGRRRANKQ